MTWSASTDNVGVTGDDVFRDGSKVGTVTGTTMTDTGVQPSTTCGYTVDASTLPEVLAGGDGHHASARDGRAVRLVRLFGGLVLERPRPPVRAGDERDRRHPPVAAQLRRPLSGILQVWNGAAQHTGADNLLHQLGAAGKSWLALEESMS